MITRRFWWYVVRTVSGKSYRIWKALSPKDISVGSDSRSVIRRRYISTSTLGLMAGFVLWWKFDVAPLIIVLLPLLLVLVSLAWHRQKPAKFQPSLASKVQGVHSSNTPPQPQVAAGDHESRLEPEHIRTGRAIAEAQHQRRLQYRDEQLSKLMYHNGHFHWRKWVKPSILPILLALVSVLVDFAIIIQGWLTNQTVLSVLTLLVVAICAYVSYTTAKRYFMWSHEWLEVINDKIYHHYAKSIVFGLKGGQPDINVYAASNHFEVGQSIFEQVFFRASCTYTINGPGEQERVHFEGLRYVVDGESLNEAIENNKAIWLELRGNSLQH